MRQKERRELEQEVLEMELEENLKKKELNKTFDPTKRHAKKDKKAHKKWIICYSYKLLWLNPQPKPNQASSVTHMSHNTYKKYQEFCWQLGTIINYESVAFNCQFIWFLHYYGANILFEVHYSTWVFNLFLQSLFSPLYLRGL